MYSNSAAFQQHRKLEIFDNEESPGFQDINDELQEIIFSLHSSMFSAKFIKSSSFPSDQPISESLNYLRYLVSTLSKALSSVPDNLEPEGLSSHPTTFPVLKKMMRAPSEGVYLKQSECKEICGLLVGDIRDEEYSSLKQKLLDSQQKLVQYSKIILENRVRIEEREKELEELYDQVDILNEEIKKSICGSRNRSKISGGSTSASINLNIWPE
jgi:hypothetical protein